MAAIFGADSQGDYQGAFRTTANTAISFNGDDITLLQSLQVSHQQPVQPLFEIGSNKRYYVVGKASGTFSAGQILGFGDAALRSVTNLADPCQGNRTLVFAIPNSFCAVGTAGVGAGSGLTLTLKGVLLQSVGFTVAAQDNLINSQIQGVITDLEYETGASAEPR
jgi:hypothetical protein